ncbi:MAG TPA: BTAD domain-containing putative transcriptional regulator [Gemmatimonadaceae bacterium]
MSEPSAVRASNPPYRLKTFGPPSLIGPDGVTVLGKSGHDHRRLALLAVLAASLDRGRSRDQLLLLFWPDSTQARARHSLEQLLYAIRESVDQSIFSGVNPVRLNPAVVSTDIGDFASNVRSGSFEAAVAACDGPFLDGFYLNDSPEFDQWMEIERSRLARSCQDALEHLAASAEKLGDHRSRLKWQKRIADLDPLSSSVAAALMRAYADAGDNTAALQHGQRYQALVARELNTAASPEITELARELRSRSHDAAGPPPVRLPTPALSSHHTGAPRENASATQTRPNRRHAILLATIVIVIAISMTAWSLTRTRDTQQPPGGRSIAVLPLENLSAGSNDASLGDGITEELIAVLARVPGLRVISRTSAFAFRNSNASVKTIGDSLHVSNLLEGSVQKDDSAMRIQVRLIDAKDGSTMWSETYERKIEDMFAVQNEIALAVARELDLRTSDTGITAMRRPGTHNIAAYELFLRGNDPALMRSDSAVRTGIEYLNQAIALDSQYAAPYASLARLHLRLSGSDTTMTRVERLHVADSLITRALSLDPDLADAHGSRSLLMRSTWQIKASVPEMERAVALDPANQRLREWLTQLYILTGRQDDALKEARTAVKLDPLSPTANAELAHAYIAMNRCDDALAQLAPLRSLKPPLLRASTFAAWCYLKKGMKQQAIAEVERIAQPAGITGESFHAFTLGAAGRTSDAQALLNRMIERYRKRGTGAVDIALVYTGLGKKDSAFVWLDKSFTNDQFVWFGAEILVEKLQGDPRIERFRERAGF